MGRAALDVLKSNLENFSSSILWLRRSYYETEDLKKLFSLVLAAALLIFEISESVIKYCEKYQVDLDGTESSQ
jgi:hypothetical protein